MTTEAQDSKAALLSWAGRDGRYSIGDLRVVLEGHGETLRSWVEACETDGRPSVCDAEAVLAWLGY